MPPKRHTQRNSRMHAAIDHMTRMGFKAKFVQNTVKSLLKEYGGSDGWMFIEEGSYQVLVERILLDQQEEEKRKEIEISSEDQADGHVSPADSNAAGPSCLPRPQDAAIETTEAGYNGTVLSKNSSGVSPPPAAAEPVDIGDQEAPTSRARVPCYGWISGGGGDDSDDVEEFDILVPAFKPETETCKKGKNVPLPPRKRHR